MRLPLNKAKYLMIISRNKGPFELINVSFQILFCNQSLISFPDRFKKLAKCLLKRILKECWDKKMKFIKNGFRVDSTRAILLTDFFKNLTFKISKYYNKNNFLNKVELSEILILNTEI